MALMFWSRPRVVVFNTCGTYRKTKSPGQNVLPGFVFVYTIPELIQVLRQSGSAGSTRVCFTPIGRNDKQQVFHDCSELVMDWGNVTYAVDEIWHFQPSVAPNALHEVQKEMFLQWRHYGLTLMYAAQQPQLVNSASRSVTTHAWVGRFNDELDIEAVRRCKLKDEGAIAALRQLPPHYFVHQYETGEWRVERS